MSAHVTNMIDDLLAGRLAPDEVVQVEGHMKKCPECASEIAWGRQIQKEAMRQGMRHIPALRMVKIGEASAAATSSEREHLSACASCRAEAQWLEGVPETPDSDDQQAESEGESHLPPSISPPRSLPHRTWILTGLAAAALILFLFIPRGGEADLAELALIEPMPVRVLRAVPDAGSFEDRLQQGLTAYRAGDYAAAVEILDEAARLNTANASSRLYLGSAHLLLGKKEEALESLSAARELARDREVKDEASWQLANALLLSGKADEAEDALEFLVREEGRRQSDARSLLESVRANR